MNITALHKELKFRLSRSSGSGGQHVNKVSTRVELIFDISGSELLSDDQKRRIRKALENRINKQDELLISSEKSRSQLLNKRAVIKKFDSLVEKALQPEKKRKPVKNLTANPKNRIKAKRHKAEKKKARQKVNLKDMM